MSARKTYTMKHGAHSRFEGDEQQQRTYGVGDEILLTDAEAAALGDRVALTGSNEAEADDDDSSEAPSETPTASPSSEKKRTSKRRSGGARASKGALA